MLTGFMDWKYSTANTTNGRESTSAFIWNLKSG